MGTCYSIVKEEMVMRKHAIERERQAKALSRNIDKQLKLFNSKEENIIKLLLLGSGNSGKSTILKQFKIFHENGFKIEQRKKVKRAIWSGAITSMKLLVNGKDDLRFDRDLYFQPNHQQHLSNMTMLQTHVEGDESRIEDENKSAYLSSPMKSKQYNADMPATPVGVKSKESLDNQVSPEIKRPKRLSSKGAKVAGIGSHNVSAHSRVMQENGNAIGNITPQNSSRFDSGIDNSVDSLVAYHEFGNGLDQNHGAADDEDNDNLINGNGHAIQETGIPGEGDHNGDYQQEYYDDQQFAYQEEEDMQPYFDYLQNYLPDDFPLYKSITIPLKPIDNPNQMPHIETKYSTSSANDMDENMQENDEQNQKSVPETKNAKGSTLSKEASRSRITSPPITSLVKLGMAGSKRGFDDSEVAKSQSEPENHSGKAGVSDKSPQNQPSSPLTSGKQLLIPEPIALKSQTSSSSAVHGSTDSSSRQSSAELTGNKQPMFATGVTTGSAASFADSDSWPTQQRNGDATNDNGISQSEGAVPDTVTMTVAQLLEKIWRHPIIQNVYRLESKIPSLEAPIAYIMQHIDRIAKRDYIPTDQDVLMVRVRTEAVEKFDFEYEKRRFQMIDVGGQKAERRKWLSHFDNVDAVFFVVGLDGYDQVLAEDGKTNRLRDSLDLFKEICDSPYFQYVSFLLYCYASQI